MSSGGIIGGVVGAVVGFLFLGWPGLIMFGLSGFLSGQSASKSVTASAIKDAVASEFEMTASSETITAPVIFGVVRNPGNYLRYEKSTFRSVPITETQASSGGKGGSKKESVTTVTGYRYYMSFDVGLCLGTVDKIRAVYDASKMKVVSGAQSFVGDSVLFNMGNEETSGNVRVYKGSMTQTRVVNEPYSQDDSNYRGVCFACFQDYYIGTNATPRTYLFELQRYPKVLDEEGNTISGFEFRGSTDPANEAYDDANPAAIIFEIMRNNEWGCGIALEHFDLASWKAVASYYAAQNIGMSMSLESQQSVSDLIDLIRQHVNMVVIWDGYQLVAKCLMDTSSAVIDDVFTSDTVKDVKFNRPAWPSMVNELKMKFVNRHAEFKEELVQVNNTAAINTAGLIISRPMTMQGFPSRSIAEAQASRLLAEFSYPQAQIEFTVTRNTRVSPGSLIQLESDEWTEGMTVSYWRVKKVSAKQDGSGLEIEAEEDLYSTAYEGDPVAHIPLVPAFERGGFNTDDDLNLGGGANLDPGSIEPIVMTEENIWMAQGRPIVIIGSEDGGNGQNGLANYWQLDSGGDIHLIGPSHGMGITGELVTAIAATGRTMCRGEEFQFQIRFTNEEKAATMLSSANKTPLVTDHFQIITQGQTDLFVIGKEIMQIGKVVESETEGVYNVQAYLRAQYGSEKEAHSIGDKWLFIAAYSTAFELTLPEALPEESAVNLIQHAVTAHTESPSAFDVPGEYGGKFVRLGMRPFTPYMLSREIDGDDWTIVVRPRWHADGAFAVSNITQDVSRYVRTIPTGYTFLIQPFASGSALADAVIAEPVFTPDNGTSQAAGVLTFEITAAGADEIRIWAMFDGKKSLAALSVEV